MSRYPAKGNFNNAEKQYWLAELLKLLQYLVHSDVDFHVMNKLYAFCHSVAVGTWYPAGHGHCLYVSGVVVSLHHHRFLLSVESHLNGEEDLFIKVADE